METLSRFAEMESYPSQFSICTVLARMLDGLGFRYYWGTDGLSEADMHYDPGNGGRSMYKTLEHLYKMIDFTGCIIEGKAGTFPETASGYSFAELRQKTLERIEETRLLCLKLSEETLTHSRISIDFGGNLSEHSIWHLFNGPLTDAYFHLGQLTSFRRTLGKPIDPYVEPFWGKRMVPQGS